MNKEKEIRMEELKEYNVKWDPNLDFEDFSKEVLVKLLREYQTLLIALDGFYQTTITKRHSIDETMKCAEQVWAMYAALEVPRIREILNIEGDDVESYFKVQQFLPSSPNHVFPRKFELENPNLGTMTFLRCLNLEWMEKKAPERIVPTCQELEKPALEGYTRMVNPKIKVTGLKVPPRKSPDEVACKWEFRLEE